MMYHKMLKNKYRNTSCADGNTLLSDSGVGNDVTLGLCRYRYYNILFYEKNKTNKTM